MTELGRYRPTWTGQLALSADTQTTLLCCAPEAHRSPPDSGVQASIRRPDVTEEQLQDRTMSINMITLGLSVHQQGVRHCQKRRVARRILLSLLFLGERMHHLSLVTD